MKMKLAGASLSVLLLFSGAASAQTSGAMVGSEDSTGAARPNSGVTPQGTSQTMEEPPEQDAEKPATSGKAEEAGKQDQTKPQAGTSQPLTDSPSETEDNK